MEIIFHSYANKTHFHKKGCAPGLILKVRAFRTRKWPIFLALIKSAFTIAVLNLSNRDTGQRFWLEIKR